jgi:transcription antitermination factor NusG
MIPEQLPSNNLSDWYAAYTFSCREKQVALHCSLRRIESFLPVHKTLNRWKNGVRALVERPLFPGYVFIKIDAREKVRVLELPGVHSLVGSGRRPVPLPYEEIEALRRGIPFLNAEPHPAMNTGERVLIRKGPLEGMTGIVVRRKNSVRVVLTLDLIMKSIAVELDGQDLEAIVQGSPAFSHIPMQDPLQENALHQS